MTGPFGSVGDSAVTLLVFALILPHCWGCGEARRYDRWLQASAAQLRAEIATPAESAELLDLILVPAADPQMLGQDDWRSLGHLLRYHRGDCDDYAVASVALLSDDGYSENLLVVGYIRWFPTSQGRLAWRGYCHVVHLLEKDGLYGANGQIYWDRIEPQFSSIEELVRHLPCSGGQWQFYKVISLQGLDYVNSPGNLFRQLARRWKQTDWVDLARPPSSQAQAQSPARHCLQQTGG